MHARRQAERVEPVARGHVEVLEALRVGRAVGVVAAGGRQQRRDGALELAEVGDVDRQARVSRSSPKRQRTLVGSASCSRATP